MKIKISNEVVQNIIRIIIATAIFLVVIDPLLSLYNINNYPVGLIGLLLQSVIWGVAIGIIFVLLIVAQAVWRTWK